MIGVGRLPPVFRTTMTSHGEFLFFANLIITSDDSHIGLTAYLHPKVFCKNYNPKKDIRHYPLGKFNIDTKNDILENVFPFKYHFGHLY